MGVYGTAWGVDVLCVEESLNYTPLPPQPLTSIECELICGGARGSAVSSLVVHIQ